jgi:hypothetical protein
MPPAGKCHNIVLDPTVFMSNVHPGHSPLRQSTSSWAYIHRVQPSLPLPISPHAEIATIVRLFWLAEKGAHRPQGLTQAEQAYKNSRPGPDDAHPWNLYLHGAINGANLLTVKGYKAVMSDLRERSQFAHVNLRSLDRLISKTKGTAFPFARSADQSSPLTARADARRTRYAGTGGVHTCFKEIAWVWSLNTTVRVATPSCVEFGASSLAR